MSEGPLEFKIIFVGAANSGKSSLIHRFVRSHFSDKTPPTAAMSFSSKDVMFNDRRVKFNIWDTAGDGECLNFGVSPRTTPMWNAQRCMFDGLASFGRCPGTGYPSTGFTPDFHRQAPVTNGR